MKRALIVLMLAMGVLVAHAMPANAADAVPYGDNRHWPRSTGSQTVVFLNVTSSARQWKPLFDNAAADWSQSSTLQVYSTTACPSGGANCVNVVYNPSLGGAGNCGGGAASISPLHVYQGHNHLSKVEVGMDISGCSLFNAQVVACHETGHALGLQHNGVGTPCYNQLHPTAGDINVVSFLHAHTHWGTIYPRGQ